MKEKWTPHIIAVMAFVVFIVLGLGSGTTEKTVKNDTSKTEDIPIVYTEISFSDLKQSIEKVNEHGHGFIVEAFIEQADPQYVLLCDTPILYAFFPQPSNTISIGKNFEWFSSVNNGSISLTTENGAPLFDKNTTYKVYVGVVLTWAGYASLVTKIEGLLTPEEANALRAQRIADEKAADEEANRYDPANFIIVPSDFRPANYTRADLFEAVATSERLSSVPESWFGIYVYPSRDFVSDVVFVRQDGTDITFRTDDNAISRRMKVDSRTGLTSGQRVRIYYTVYRIRDWRVEAIERL